MSFRNNSIFSMSVKYPHRYLLAGLLAVPAFAQTSSSPEKPSPIVINSGRISPAYPVAYPPASTVEIKTVLDRVLGYLETASPVRVINRDTHAIVTDGCAAPTLNCLYSGGSGTNLQANAMNDFVIYRTASLPSGTFAVTIRYKRGPNAGLFRVAVSSSQGGPYATLGSEQDGFGTASDWVTVSLANLNVVSPGQRFFRFMVTGRNGASSGFQLFPDYIDLVK